jgi:hypothetical protein
MPTPTIDPDRLANAVAALKGVIQPLTYMGIHIADHVTADEYNSLATAILMADDKFRAAPAI